MASRDEQLWDQVNEVLRDRPGWSVQESPTPGIGPYWALTSHGKVDFSVFVDGAAAHLYEEETDREVQFGTAEELGAWLDGNRPASLPGATPEPRHHYLEWN